MDKIIPNLLMDFEAGKISRRQLLQSMAIALTATAASTTRIAPMEAAQLAGFKATAVNHIS